VLVNDDDSICYPCAVQEVSLKNSYDPEAVGNSNDNQAKKERQQLWKNMISHGIVDRMVLSNKITTNLQCMQCMQDQLIGARTGGTVKLNDARLLVATKNLGFACMLSVMCAHSKHHFTVEPMCIPPTVKGPIMSSQDKSIQDPPPIADLTSGGNKDTSSNQDNATSKKNMDGHLAC